MISPCPRCGETKTDPVSHGVIYKLVWVFGYRLHRCSRCRAPRFVPSLYGKSLGSSQLRKEPASAPGFVEERGGLKGVPAQQPNSTVLLLHRLSAAGGSAPSRVRGIEGDIASLDRGDDDLAEGPNRMLKNPYERCHSERSEESRSGNKGLARFLVACGSSE